MHMLPRYLRIAHWMHEQQRYISSEDVARQFNLPLKRVCDDIFLIRQRVNVIESNELKERRDGKWWRLVKVTCIHEYILDSRNFPHRVGAKQHKKPDVMSSVWHVLLSTHLNKGCLLDIVQSERHTVTS